MKWYYVLAGGLAGGLLWHCIALMVFTRLEVLYWWERWVEMPAVAACCVYVIAKSFKILGGGRK